MSGAWVDKMDNPGMAELGLQSTDVYGGVVVVNLADLIWQMGLTADFEELCPVTRLQQLEDLSWFSRARYV